MEAKDLGYWKNNAEEDYLQVPISVLRYITELENAVERSYSEEDMKNAFTQGFNARYKMQDGIESRDKFMEQFKKK